MFDHDAMRQTVPLIGIDLCFSGIQQQHHFPIRAMMRDRMRYADLDKADWFWACYSNITHIVALHEPTLSPEPLIGHMQDMVMDIGIGIASFMQMIRGAEGAVCEGMEFYVSDSSIPHSAHMLHRI